MIRDFKSFPSLGFHPLLAVCFYLKKQRRIYHGLACIFIKRTQTESSREEIFIVFSSAWFTERGMSPLSQQALQGLFRKWIYDYIMHQQMV